ncbi:unnamed protein product, partial [Closterium sp. NIES-54]
SGGVGPCTYVLRTGGHRGKTCGLPHTALRCFGRLTDAWRAQFPDAVELPRWGDLLKHNVAIFDLDFDAILAAMYAVTDSAEVDCYLSVRPDPGIEAAALGASASAAPSTSESAAPGAGEPALSSTAPTEALHAFTLDSGASRSFFRDGTTLTPLSQLVAISLADPSGGPVLAHSSTVLPCPADPSGLLSGLHLPSFSTNLVSGADLQDAWVDPFTPGGQRVTHCTCSRTGRHLATFTRRPGSSLYTLTTASPPVVASGWVAASGQVFSAASRSSPESAPCSCHPLSHETLLWHHRLGHPSLPRLRGMASRTLFSGLPRSLPPLPSGPAPTCVPCVEGRQRAAPHSSDPARVRGQGHEHYFLLGVDDYSRYTTVFPLHSKGEVTEVLINWICVTRRQLSKSFGSDLPVLCLHSDRGGEFSSDLLRAFCRMEGICQTFTLPASPQQNGIAERRIGMVMDVACTSMIHTAAPHFLWPFEVQYATHQINLQPRVSLPETTPTLRWTGKVGVASLFRGPAPSGVSQVDPVEPVEVAVDSGAARGAEVAGVGTGGAELGGAEPECVEPGVAEPERVEPGGAEFERVGPGVAKPGGAESGSAEPARAESGGPPAAGGASGAAGGAAGAGAAGGAAGAGAAGAAGPGGAGAGGTGALGGPAGVEDAGGAGAAGPGGARTGGTGAAGAGGAATVGAGAASTQDAAGAGPVEGPGAGGTVGVVAVDPGAEGTGPTPPLLSPLPVQSPSQLQPASPLPGPSPYSGPTSGLMERCEPESRPVSPESRPTSRESRSVHAGRRVSCPRPPPVPGPHSMTLRPSTAPQRVPLPSPPASSLPDGPEPESDSLRAASPTVTRFLATVVTDPLFLSTAASALVAELVDFAAACRLDYATSLVAESECASVCPSSVRVADMVAKMASWKSTGTYVDEVPPPGANIISGMWIFRVKRPPGSPPVFKARYVARGFSQRQGVDFFQTFSPTPKMTTLRVLLHIASQRDYELLSLDFSTAFLQGSLHEEIWLRRPPGFTGSFPADDLVFATADTEALAHVKSELRKRHTCTDLGELTSYLGLRITRDRAQCTITLTQSHMVHQVLQHFGFTYCSPLSTPLPTGQMLSAPPSDESVEPSGPYPELVGCLMCLMTCTLPDLAYPLSLLARYVAPCRHRKVHWDAAKRVFRYLCSTLSSGSASWRSTSSSSVLSSSCEAEIYVGAMATQELRWLTYLLTDLGEAPRSPPVLYVDNKAMLALCQEHRLEHRTKHIALRYFLARELQQRGQLRLAYVASQANTADVFTKALQPCDHQRFCTVLGLGPAPSGVSQVDPLLGPAPVQVAVDSGVARGAAFGGAEPGGTKSEGAETTGAEPGGVDSGGAEPGCVVTGGVDLGGAEPRGAVSEGAESGGAGPHGAASSGGSAGASPRLSPQQLREWFVRRTRLRRGASGAGGAGAAGAGVTGGTAITGSGAGGAGVGDPSVGGARAGGAGAFDPCGTPASPLPAPSPYTEQSGGLTEHREPASRPVSPVRTARRVPHLRPPPVLGTHTMTLHPSSVPLCVPLPAPPDPTVSRLLATAVTDPSFESAAASALVAQLLEFAAACRLDYANALVAESESASPPSVGGECALGTDILEDRQEDFECLAAAVPRFASMLLAPEGDPDAPDIPTRGDYGVRRPPGSPPAFKARYVARGFCQRKGVDYFQTFSPTPKMTTLQVLLHVAAQRDYELHSLDFSTAFLQGSLHEEIWLRRLPGFSESFLAGTQWRLRRPVYSLRQAPREWHDTLRTTLAALRFSPSTADPSMFLRIDTSLPPFYVLVYVDDLVFAIADTEALNLVLHRFVFHFSSPQPTPLSTSHSLSAPPSDKSVEPSGPYPELVGCLMYLMTCTRPDLAYPLSLLARYVAPGRHRNVHWDDAKRVLRYLCCTSGMGLVLGGLGPVVLTGHADSSWADDSATQRLSHGYTFSLGATLAHLPADRLGRAASFTSSSVRRQKAMIALCQEQRLEHKTKHIALRYFLPRELQQRGQLRLAYMATRANTADVFTKALPPGDHQRFVTVLGLVPSLPHLLTA